jgi:hypothetical protein
MSIANGLVILSLFLAFKAPRNRPTAAWWIAGGLLIATHAHFIEKRLARIVAKTDSYVHPFWRRRSRYVVVAYLAIAFLSPFLAAMFGRHPG